MRPRFPGLAGFLCVFLAVFLLAGGVAQAGISLGGDRPPMRLDKELKCAACTLVTQAIRRELASVDEKASVKIGHRLASGRKPTASGGGKHIEYARSEVHITDLLDGLCAPFEKYDAIQTNADGSRTFVEVNNRPKGSEGSSLSLRGGEGRALAGVCYELLDLHEDELAELIRTSPMGEESSDQLEEFLHTRVCKELTKHCAEPGKKKRKKKKKQKPQQDAKKPKADEKNENTEKKEKQEENKAQDNNAAAAEKEL